ncbi:hypothetical protein JRQ81_009330 [Phrynocephalus forsythii]|uniref:RRM domain-containing protein n=1 Tax=Phrynocephalus forsythii TaxID=171643 RepID=A0A9Q0XCZ1_9SAUR|nr:hypothetical protein JRQ81_009330 [Phrynocephalus forsythii]
MAGFGRGWVNTPALKQTIKPSLHHQPGAPQKKQTEIFVGNLPQDVKEVDVAIHFKDFGVKSVKKCTSRFKRFCLVELISAEAAQLAIQMLNGSLWGTQRIIVSMNEDRRGYKCPQNSTGSPGKMATKEKEQAHGSPPNGTETPGKMATKEDRPNHESTTPNLPEMPDLEPVPWEEQWMNCDPALKGDAEVSPSLKPEVCYAVPMEMRSLFLLQMSLDCFKGTAWLFSVAKIQGKAGLLVMDATPQTPYFWAVHLTQESREKMTKLFAALAKAESQLPFLAKPDVRPGKRCLAECSVGDGGNAWNRCWVLDRGEDLAIVFFVDFGRPAAVPLNALRDLNDDKFWAIGPLARPFMLQGEVFPREEMRRKILEGTVIGPSEREVGSEFSTRPFPGPVLSKY